MPSKLPISALLNPVPEPSQTSSPSPASVNQADSMSATVAQTKPHRRKGVKKGVILPGSPPQDQVKYPVHVDYDSKFSAFHAEFGMEPTQVIANRHCHIPYDPKKRDFSQRTGRTGFDVFLYTFKVRDERTGLEQEEREMMWDYKNGLVRTTHLFRCNRSFDKTCPKRMLQSTPGLMPNAHNITGGNVIRQGYFVPWECARALATRFCWDVRYALTPIFGNDFPEDCLHPDHPDYRQWLIDPEIVHDSAEKQAMYCRLEVQASRLYLSPSPDAESTGILKKSSPQEDNDNHEECTEVQKEDEEHLKTYPTPISPASINNPLPSPPSPTAPMTPGLEGEGTYRHYFHNPALAETNDADPQIQAALTMLGMSQGRYIWDPPIQSSELWFRPPSPSQY